MRSESKVSLSKTMCSQYVTNSTGTTIISRLFHLPGTFILDSVYVPGHSRPVHLFGWTFQRFGLKCHIL